MREDVRGSGHGRGGGGEEGGAAGRVMLLLVGRRARMAWRRPFGWLVTPDAGQSTIHAVDAPNGMYRALCWSLEPSLSHPEAALHVILAPETSHHQARPGHDPAITRCLRL